MISHSRFIRRTRAPISILMGGMLMLAGVSVPAQDDAFPVPPPPGAGNDTVPGVPLAPGTDTGKLILLNFRDSPLDQVLEFVADLMGRTLLKSPGINATVTLKSQTRLTVAESLQAIEAVLAMNNISLVPMGEKFLKVVQTAAARQEAMPLGIRMPEQELPEADHLISQVVVLKYIETAEAVPIIQGLLHGYGKIQELQRTNSLLITDTANNLKRVLELLDYVDQPAEAMVETRIYELRYAEAAQVASRLNELIADTQAKEDKPRVESAQAPAAPQIPNPPGVIRATPPGYTPPAAAAAAGAAGETAAEAAERGVIRGKVKIIADERTNIMFVISRPENFSFFDKIVAVLDRPIEPGVIVRVVPLEYAEAETVAGILNEFIGAATQDKKATGAAAAQTGDQAAATGDARSQELRDFVLRQAETRIEQARAELAEATSEKGKIGRLSPNTRILADKRTNSLLLMGTKGDLEALEDVLANLDVMLAQVLMEVVILEVTLSDSSETGFAWLQRSMTAYNEQYVSGIPLREPIFSFGGSSVPRELDFRGGDTVTRESPGSSVGALTYFFTINDFNLDAVVRLAAQSTEARVLSTPVVLTTDNTEAKLVAAEQRPVVTSSTIQTTGQNTQNFEYRNVGLSLTVTPRINPAGFVMMEVSQTADEVLSETQINDTTVPIIGKRELTAQIGVQNHQTVVLGGLVRTDNSKSRAKVPILGDIPLLGFFFRSDAKRANRSELMVMITPYVLKTPEEALAETKRLYDNSANSATRWHKGWSGSELPDKSPKDLMREAKDKKERESEVKRILERVPPPTPPIPKDIGDGAGKGAPKVSVYTPPSEQDDETVAEPAGEAPKAPAEKPAADRKPKAKKSDPFNTIELLEPEPVEPAEPVEATEPVTPPEAIQPPAPPPAAAPGSAAETESTRDPNAPVPR